MVLKSITLEKQTELPAGTKSYDFSFELPTSLRSTFHGNDGSTKYWIKATVDIPMGLDKDESKEIHVSHIRNLNKDDTTLEKVEKQEMKTFGALCCETGPITMNYVLNKNGFVSGEKIIINIQVFI